MNILTRSLHVGLCAGVLIFLAAEAQAQTIWTGTTSNEYATDTNWSTGAVPTGTDDVVIPAGTPNQPVVSAVGTSRNITVAAGATLSIPAGGIFTLRGNMTDNGAVGGAGEIEIAGTAPQTGVAQSIGGTGGGIPSTFPAVNNTPINLGNLMVSNTGTNTLNHSMTITRRLQLNTNLTTTAGNPLTMISTTAVTSFVVNSGGVVVGDVTVQRAITSSNTGLGYRHYSSPVANSTVADLTVTAATAATTPGYPGTFTPEISNGVGYNTSSFPQATTPFPTVYNYDQARVANPGITYVGGSGSAPGISGGTVALDKGFRVPVAGDTLGGLSLQPGRGYAVNIVGTALVDFVGTLNNGTYSRTLTRNAPGTPDYASSGYHLLGNPYPAPLDFSQLAPPTNPVGGTPVTPNLVNVDATIAVVRSTSQYGNTYRYYNSLTNSVNPTLPVGQGFFIRVSNTAPIRTKVGAPTPGTTAVEQYGTITFQNSQRLVNSDFTPFQRTNVITHPQVELSLTSGAVPSMDDLAIIYFENGATAGMDSRYDGVKLSNSTGLNVSTIASTGEVLAIDGRPMPTGTLTVPLQVFVPTNGTYTLAAANLMNMNGMYTYLRDIQTGTMTNLAQQSSYTFTQVATNFTPRFELVFSARALATAAALLTQQVSVYPNPAHTIVSVELPASLGRQALTATLTDAMGRSVRTTTLPAQGTAAHNISLNGLAAGIYSLQVRTDAGLVVKRLVIE